MTMNVCVRSINKNEECMQSTSVYPDDIKPFVDELPYYRMDHPKKGIALIFNHEKFADPRHLEREGSAKDREELTTCLTKIGFNVTPFNDLKLADIHMKLSTLAAEDHSDSSCILIAVLTHGDTGILRAYDRSYETPTLWAKFTADQCPSLAGKPKLFIIQACQGRQLDPGKTICSTIQTDGPGCSKFLQLEPDFLVAFATVPDYKCFRHTETGSVFIQAVCDVLKEKWMYHDLLTILTYVSHQVAIKFESEATQQCINEKKQIPSTTSTLTKLLKFKNII